MRKIQLTEKEKIEILIKELDERYKHCFECNKLFIAKYPRDAFYYLGKKIYLCNHCSENILDLPNKKLFRN